MNSSIQENVEHIHVRTLTTLIKVLHATYVLLLLWYLHVNWAHTMRFIHALCSLPKPTPMLIFQQNLSYFCSRDHWAQSIIHSWGIEQATHSDRNRADRTHNKSKNFEKDRCWRNNLTWSFENILLGLEYAYLRSGGPKKLNLHCLKELQ